MANHMISDLPSDLAFVDKRRSTAGSVALSTNSIGTLGNYGGINALRTRLFAISPTAYSQANLNAMTANDMVYALRLNDDPLSI